MRSEQACFNNTYAGGGVFWNHRAEGRHLQAGAQVSGEWQDANEVDGVKTGRNKSAGYAGPALYLGLARGLRLMLAYDFPVYNEDEGLRGAADQRLRAGVNWRF